MDIGSRHGYPASALSNFAPHKFIFDGVECNSMEGFLQSLKFKNYEMQKEICKLVGFKAKMSGSKKNWKSDQTLYWKGAEYKRNSLNYQGLLWAVYQSMFRQSEGFRTALKATGDAVLTHSIGKNKINETILTETEFVRFLTDLRKQL